MEGPAPCPPLPVSISHLPPRARQIIFTVPDENVNNGSTAEEAAILSPKKEAEVVSNKGPLSPQIHQRTGRKAMLRSPSPAPASPEPIPTAKKAAARSTRKSTRKAPSEQRREGRREGGREGGREFEARRGFLSAGCSDALRPLSAVV